MRGLWKERIRRKWKGRGGEDMGGVQRKERKGKGGRKEGEEMKGELSKGNRRNEKGRKGNGIGKEIHRVCRVDTFRPSRALPVISGPIPGPASLGPSQAYGPPGPHRPLVICTLTRL